MRAKAPISCYHIISTLQTTNQSSYLPENMSSFKTSIKSFKDEKDQGKKLARKNAVFDVSDGCLCERATTCIFLKDGKDQEKQLTRRNAVCDASDNCSRKRTTTRVLRKVFGEDEQCIEQEIKQQTSEGQMEGITTQKPEKRRLGTYSPPDVKKRLNSSKIIMNCQIVDQTITNCSTLT